MLQDGDLNQYWQSHDVEAPGIQPILTWLSQQQGMTPDQHPDCQQSLQQLERVLSTVDPVQAQNALADTAAADQLIGIIASSEVKRAMRLLFWAIEQTDGQVLTALQRLATSDPAAARQVIFHWQQICRWTTMQRMCAPERLATVHAAIQRAQRNLGLMASTDKTR